MGGRAQRLCVLRAMLPSALLVSPLLGGSVHCEIHLFGLIEKALQSSDRSRFLKEEGGPSSHCAVALSRSEAIGHREAARLALGPLRRDHHLLFPFSFALLRIRCFLQAARPPERSALRSGS